MELQTQDLNAAMEWLTLTSLNHTGVKSGLLCHPLHQSTQV